MVSSWFMDFPVNLRKSSVLNWQTPSHNSPSNHLWHFCIKAHYFPMTAVSHEAIQPIWKTSSLQNSNRSIIQSFIIQMVPCNRPGQHIHAHKSFLSQPQSIKGHLDMQSMSFPHSKYPEIICSGSTTLYPVFHTWHPTIKTLVLTHVMPEWLRII